MISRKAWLGGGVLLAGLLLAIQFVPAGKTNPPVESDLAAPPEVKEILRRACYDCHSHETAWPWYTNVAPVSWWIAGHVKEARADLNFSRWPVFDFEMQKHLLREIGKQIRNDAMPLRSYRLGHPEARLTDQEKRVLLDWADL